MTQGPPRPVLIRDPHAAHQRGLADIHSRDPCDDLLLILRLCQHLACLTVDGPEGGRCPREPRAWLEKPTLVLVATLKGPRLAPSTRLINDLEDHGLNGVSGQQPDPIFLPERTSPQGIPRLIRMRSVVQVHLGPPRSQPRSCRGGGLQVLPTDLAGMEPFQLLPCCAEKVRPRSRQIAVHIEVTQLVPNRFADCIDKFVSCIMQFIGTQDANHLFRHIQAVHLSIGPASPVSPVRGGLMTIERNTLGGLCAAQEPIYHRDALRVPRLGKGELLTPRLRPLRRAQREALYPKGYGAA